MKKRRSYGSVRRLPSGYFQASIPSPEFPGRRENAPTTFTSQGDADTWIARQKVLISDGKWSSRASEPLVMPDFGEFARQHIKVQTSKRGGLLRASTKEMLEGLLHRHLKIFIGQPLSKISMQEVDEWFAELVMTGKRTTASKAYSLLSAVMKRAVSQGLINSNPCQIEGARGASSEKLVDVPTDAQMERILNHTPARWKLQVYFLARTALRFGELAALRVDDLVWESGDVVGVKVTKAAACLRGGVIIDKPKTRMSRRQVPISPDLKEPLAQLAAASDSGALLFPGVAGNVQRVDSFSKTFAKAVKSAGLEGQGISLHGLRHYGGTKFGETGASLAEIKNFLGDASTKAAERYLHGSASNRGMINRVKGLGASLLEG